MTPRRKQPRAYSSAIRSEQAKATRQKVIDAAARLFVERGYAPTTIVAIADSANVSAETVYGVFDGKRGLLEAVIDATIMGPSAIPLEEQAAWDAIAALATPRERLAAYVDASCAVLARTSAMHQVIRSAADSEPFAIELAGRLLAERLAANTKRLREYVGDALAPNIPLKRAAERYCALTSPEMHHLLIERLGWSRRQHQDWVTTVVERDLLDA